MAKIAGIKLLHLFIAKGKTLELSLNLSKRSLLMDIHRAKIIDGKAIAN